MDAEKFHDVVFHAKNCQLEVPWWNRRVKHPSWDGWNMGRKEGESLRRIMMIYVSSYKLGVLDTIDYGL